MDRCLYHNPGFYKFKANTEQRAEKEQECLHTILEGV